MSNQRSQLEAKCQEPPVPSNLVRGSLTEAIGRPRPGECELVSLTEIKVDVQDSAAATENRTDEAIHSHYGTAVMATMIQAGEEVQYKLSATSSHEKLGNMLFTTSHLTPHTSHLTCN